MQRLMGVVMGRHWLGMGCVAAMLMGCLAGPAMADGFGKPAPKPGSFDYLALSLSWSPSYCATSTGQHDREQCGGPTRYGFIAHGLWPVFPKGAGSAAHGCGGDTAGLTDKSVEKVQGIMPSHKLLNHEWEKHGTCMGGDAASYFGKVRTAWDKLKMPPKFKPTGGDGKASADQIKRAFVDANPGLSAENLAVICQHPRGKGAGEKPLVLKEVRVCLDKGLGFKVCGAQIRDHCVGEAVIPSFR